MCSSDLGEPAARFNMAREEGGPLARCGGGRYGARPRGDEPPMTLRPRAADAPPAQRSQGRIRDGLAGGEWLRLMPGVTVAIFLLPVIAGLLGTLLPSFGYLPELGGRGFSLEPWRMLLAAPELPASFSTCSTGCRYSRITRPTRACRPLREKHFPMATWHRHRRAWVPTMDSASISSRAG